MPSADLTLRLKKGFRNPLSAGVGFVGREAEISRLSALIKNRPAATVLVSGHRGVGKTTLVDEALRKTSDSGNLVVRMSLPHLRSGSLDIDEVRGQVLRSLARSLHFELKDSKASSTAREKAKELYDKTYLRELQREGHLSSLRQGELRESESSSTEVTFNPGPALRVLLGVLAGGATASAAVGLGYLIGSSVSWWLAALGFLVIVAGAVLGGFRLRDVTTHESSTTKTILSQKTSATVGSYDLSPETLEFELHELLALLSKDSHKVVFVIDELDKLEIAEEESEPLERHVIFAILSSLKNFFTMGAGIFIFISGESFYARLEESISASTYSLAHTLFTDRIFVHVLPYHDLEKLIDGLIEAPQLDNLPYRQFRNYLCWLSRSHVFDLLSILGDFVTEYDGDVPIPTATESHESDGRWHEGNLPENWVLAASLQQTVGATYDESTRPGGSKERYNQALWLTLISAAESLVAKGEIDVPLTGYTVDEDSQWVRHLGSNDLDDLSGAVDRLLSRAERYGVVVADDIAIEGAQDDPSDAAAEGIQYSIADKAPYPDSSVGMHAALTPFEGIFLRVVDAVDTVASNLESAGVDFSLYDADLDSIRDVADKVRSRPGRKAPPRSQTRAALEEADALQPELLSYGVSQLVKDWAETQEATVLTELAPSGDAQASSQALAEFESLRLILIDEALDYLLLTSNGRENQLLVLMVMEPTPVGRVYSTYKDSSPGKKGQERRRQRLPVLEIRKLPPDATLDIPSEVVDQFENSTVRSWLASLTQASAASGSSANLAGWNVFRLDPDGTNVGELRDELSSVSFL